MKRFFMLFLGALCLALVLGGCGKREEPAKAPAPKTEQRAAPPAAQPEPAKPEMERKEQTAPPSAPSEEKPAPEKPAEPKKP